MFSLFKKESTAQDAALRDLTEGQLLQVAGGYCANAKKDDDDDDDKKKKVMNKHKHHHHHHHMMKKTNDNDWDDKKQTYTQHW